jgi:hypothetical protein
LKVLSFSDLTSIGGAAVAYNRVADSLRSKGNQVQTVTAEESIISDTENSVLFQGKKNTTTRKLILKSITRSIAFQDENQSLEKSIRNSPKTIQP